MNASHAGDLGDVIYAIPAMRTLSPEINLTLYPKSGITRALMTPENAANILPLLNDQKGFKATWNDAPQGLVMDAWRPFYHHGLNLADMVQRWLGQDFWPREKPWLTVRTINPQAPFVVARSHRYRNPRFPWDKIHRQISGEAVFVGTREEHDDYERCVGDIPHIPTASLREVAEIIAGARMFIGNQSSPRAVAEGLKIPCLVEESGPEGGDTYWPRTGAIYSREIRSFVPFLGVFQEIHEQALAARAADRTLVDGHRLAVIARLAKERQAMHGDMAELGVYRGGSAAVLAATNPHKPLWLFDTFEGIPADDVFPEGHRRGDFPCSWPVVESFLQIHQVRKIQGYFPSSTQLEENKQCLSARFSVVHIDGDLYESTKSAIEWFLPRMTPGGVMIFDDFEWERCPGVRKAIAEARLSIRQAALKQCYAIIEP